jgi:hypothetical protein
VARRRPLPGDGGDRRDARRPAGARLARAALPGWRS